MLTGEESGTEITRDIRKRKGRIPNRGLTNIKLARPIETNKERAYNPSMLSNVRSGEDNRFFSVTENVTGFKKKKPDQCDYLRNGIGGVPGQKRQELQKSAGRKGDTKKAAIQITT